MSSAVTSSASQDLSPLCIAGVGAVTAVGNNSRETAAAVTANLLRVTRRAIPGVSDEPVRYAECSGVTDGLTQIERLSAMAIPALSEALADAISGSSNGSTTYPQTPDGHPWAIGPAHRLPIFVAVSDALHEPDANSVQGPGTSARKQALSEKLLHALADALQVNPDFLELYVCEAGEAGAFLALRGAYEHFRQSRSAAVFSADGKQRVWRGLVGAVDSWLEPSIHRRALAAGWTEGPNGQSGMMPSEAAAFVALRQMPADSRAIYLHPPALVQAPRPPCTLPVQDGASLGQTIIHAVRSSRLRYDEIEMIYTDFNGEVWKALQQNLAVARVFAREYRAQTIYPAINMGDVGAAWGALQWVLAFCHMQGVAVNPLATRPRGALCMASSHGLETGACVLEHANRQQIFSRAH